MSSSLRNIFFTLLLYAIHNTIYAQGSQAVSDNIFSTRDSAVIKDTNRQFVIRNIFIEGNDRTRISTITRELSFHEKEAYPLNVIIEKFYESRKQLMNTGLFTNVVVSLKSLQGYDVYVKIEVEEKWYVYPLPFLRAVDKSFHQWWTEKNRSFDRVNYGIKITDYNFTGRNDKLDVKLMGGFTRQIAIDYYNLFLDRGLKWSASAGFDLGQNREINYITLDNKQVSFRNQDHYLNSYINSFMQLSWRPAIKTKHSFRVGYSYNDIADTISKLNPHFSNNKNIIRYLDLSYTLSYRDVDYIYYPTSGYMGDLKLMRQGFNDPVNLWQITAKGSASWPVGTNYFFNLAAAGVLKLPFRQPYITKQLIGYDDLFLQGYEYYVIDGVAGGYTKATISRPVWQTHISLPSKKIKELNYIPLKLYAKTFINMGYVYNPEAGPNLLNNRMLYSAGIGLDIVASTDFVIKIEWSFNQLGQNGVYLHRINYF
jgi:outer membrane protein assembly factor BamA